MIALKVVGTYYERNETPKTVNQKSRHQRICKMGYHNFPKTNSRP